MGKYDEDFEQPLKGFPGKRVLGLTASLGQLHSVQ